MVSMIEKASDGKGFRLQNKSEIIESDVVVTGSRNQKKIAAKMQKMLQDQIDHRESRASLPDYEITKTIDPARPNEFWDGDDVVSRSEVITINVVFFPRIMELYGFFQFLPQTITISISTQIMGTQIWLILQPAEQDNSIGWSLRRGVRQNITHESGFRLVIREPLVLNMIPPSSADVEKLRGMIT